MINQYCFFTDSPLESAIGKMLDIYLAPEVVSSLIVMLLICILAFIVYFKFKKADPLQEKPSKFISVITMLVEMVQNFVVGVMGKKWKNFAGYGCVLFLYVFLAFTFSLVGLPGPMTYMAIPLSLGLCTFLLIHITAAKANKWKYFKRFTDPVPALAPIFVPINLLSMWSPLLSLSLRLFGNAISGSVLMGLIYYFFSFVSNIVFGFIFEPLRYMILTPAITSVFHMYFDIFSGLIQTLVFTMLTMIFVSQEDPDESGDEMLIEEN